MKRTAIKNWMYRWTEPAAAPLSATVLLVLATSRMAYALICVFTLLWTCVISGLVRFVLRKVMP
ncbi:MAG: hypothetical protein LBC72_04350, partial [Spirochaetaceae bacterium]|nr:hypothetical protein [Spirochaetaceae bacterium]